MKLTVSKPVEIEAAAIRCVIPVRYDEEDIPNDFPLRKGDVWEVTVDIATGQIRGWPAGTPAAEVDMKVVDEGFYYLLDANGGELAKIEQDYVPSCIPGRYGDYIEFKIDETGRITNWEPDTLTVRRSFFGDDE